MMCYYDILIDLGIIDKIDSYRSFPRVHGAGKLSIAHSIAPKLEMNQI